MNNTFSLQRFIWLFNRYTKENYKLYLVNTLVMAGMLVIVMGYFAYFKELSVSLQERLFMFFLLISGINVSNVSFADLWEKNRAISVLTLPVSSLEQFLVRWIYSFVIFQLLFIACFYVVDMTILSLVNRNAASTIPLINLSSSKWFFYYVFLGSALFHSVNFLGSVAFRKLNGVFATLLFLSVLIAVVVFNQGFVHFLFGNNADVELPFTSIFVQEGLSSYDLEDKVLMKTVVPFVLIASTFCLWVAAYFKLKEKQV